VTLATAWRTWRRKEPDGAATRITWLVRQLIPRMMDRGMIIHIDHMSVKAAEAVLDMATHRHLPNGGSMTGGTSGPDRRPTRSPRRTARRWAGRPFGTRTFDLYTDGVARCGLSTQTGPPTSSGGPEATAARWRNQLMSGAEA
jgi:hypothetical protein